MNWVEVNGAALRWELTGAGNSTLVLVHEMGGTLDSWEQCLPALNNSRQVLRYDTRGAGLSEKIKGAAERARWIVRRSNVGLSIAGRMPGGNGQIVRFVSVFPSQLGLSMAVLNIVDRLRQAVTERDRSCAVRRS